MYTVLLSGGSGKRLWPLSNEVYSKQYIRLVDNADNDELTCSMLQRVWGQLDRVGLAANTVISATTAQVDIITNQIGCSNVRIAEEPERRDTFPAIMLACAYIISELKAKDDEYVVIMPVDPYTDNSFFQGFRELERAMQMSNSSIGLVGAVPTYPSEKYGYIIPDESKGGYLEVKEFKEKPSQEQAKVMIENGGLWNCGVFCFSVKFAKACLEKYSMPLDYMGVRQQYGLMPKNSFDYEILEACRDIIAIPYDGKWKDLGTWNTLTEEMKRNTLGNVVLSEECMNTHVINMLNIPVVVMGIHEAVVAVSHDGILVSGKYESSFLKERLAKLNDAPRYEEMRWGHIKTLDETGVANGLTVTKRIKVNSGQNTSYAYRSASSLELFVISGDGEIIRDGRLHLLSANDALHINIGEPFAIRAFSDIRIIAVKTFRKDHTDTYCDDTHHLEYDWENIIKEYLK